MIQISQLKLKIDHSEADLRNAVQKALRLKEDALLSYRIKKQSIDARKKPALFYVYTIEAIVKKGVHIPVSAKVQKVSDASAAYRFLPSGSQTLVHRPAVIGSGPAGLFCAYFLSLAGYKPILLERGMPVEQRIAEVDAFFRTGRLNPISNVQFGEGGAGTFSDGKLNTLVKDPGGIGRKVLEILVEHGAPPEILYQNKPHIGTDVLAGVVKQIREHIIKNGGEVRFHTQVTDFITADTNNVRPVLQGLVLLDTLTQQTTILETGTAVLAIGHSARDTFSMLKDRGVPMEAKSFAVGVRVEHPQSMINEAQYGKQPPGILSAADYKLTEKLPCGRGVYTFCMCPGGYVVNASSEEGRLCVNGMSYHKRDSENANSAVIVTVTPQDFQGSDPLAGVAFQRQLEEKAFAAGRGRIPVQLFEDFCGKITSKSFGGIHPCTKGDFEFGDVRGIFPEELAACLEQGIRSFDRKLPGFARPDTLLLGVEARTSSPVRILRGTDMESTLKGLYPCGEGAGYAGGITSAAMDGIKTAEAIVRKYHPFDKEGE